MFFIFLPSGLFLFLEIQNFWTLLETTYDKNALKLEFIPSGAGKIDANGRIACNL